MTRPPAHLALLTAIAVALGGCENPYADRRPADAGGPAAQRQTDAATTIASHSSFESTLARRAARAFAVLWVNWDWQSASTRQRALARLATGALAGELRANAVSSRINASLTRDKPGSRGTVAAVNLTISGAHGAGIVITREQTYTDRQPDLGGRHYRVYRIHLQHDHDRWTVTRWAPQP